MLKALTSRTGVVGGLGVAIAGTALAAAFFIVLMLMQHRSWMEFAVEREFFSRHSSMIRESVAKTHIMIEEAIAKSNSESYALSLAEIGKAVSLVDEMGEHVKPDDSEYHAILKKKRSALEELKRSSSDRWKLAGAEGYAEAESRFHDDFSRTMEMSEKMATVIQSRANASIKNIENRFQLSLAVWLVIVSGGFTAFVIMARKREKAEEALKHNEESLERAQAIAHMGSWDWDIVTGSLEWSDEIYRIFGLKPQEFGATYEAFLARVHPDDREMVTKAVETAIKDKTPYNIEHRLVRPNGSVRLVNEIGRTFYGPEGTPVRMIGTVQDITEHKQTEDQLNLARQVFENALEGVIVTDAKGVILFANPAVFTITGYSPEELIGKNPRVFRSDRHPKEFYDEMWESIVNEGGWQGIIWNRRKDGEAFPEWLSITAVKDSIGKTSRYVSVFYDMSLIKQSQDTLKRQAYEDALTKLPNRLLFEDRLENAIAAAGRAGGKVGVTLIGVDRFKNINETLGFPAGDLLIQKAAERLRPLLRDGDTLARFGGDEFVCLMQNIKDEQDVVKQALAMLKEFSIPFNLGDGDLFITASAGAAFYPSDGMDGATLVQNALVAMRRAKGMGRNTYQLYTPAMNERSYERLTLENDLRKALEREEFVVYYQPKLSIVTGAVIGMEALVRWIHPVRGMVSPVEFIPLAEETGLIAPIGDWVMAESLSQMKKWISQGYEGVSVAVNLSAAQFRNKNLLMAIKDKLDHAGAPAAALDLEITESMVMGDVNAAISTLKSLRDIGVKISMDDFGTGYSSLSHLKRFPIHCLKVDRSFIRDITTNDDDAAITTAIISMAHRLKLTVVAEGVETAEQLKFLRDNGCDEMQGYLFSPPVSATEMTKILASSRTLSSFSG